MRLLRYLRQARGFYRNYDDKPQDKNPFKMHVSELILRGVGVGGSEPPP